jgi:hypothetical protein
VICGLIVFKFSTKELGQVLSMPEQKIKFIVNQSFKKTSQISIIKPVVKTDFAYKKKEDNQVSYLFTNENLVEHGLGLLSDPDRTRVEQGLTLYKQLVPLQSYYKEIIDELQNLLTDTNNSYYLQAQETHAEKHGPETPTVSFDFIKIQKKFVVLTTVSVVFIALVMIRPSWLQKFPIGKSTGGSVVVQEIKSQPYVTDVAQRDNDDAINLHEMPVAKNETAENTIAKPTENKKTEVAAVTSPAKAADVASAKPVVATPPTVPAETTAKPTPVAKVDIKPAPPSEENHSGKKVSGLYRASIVVTDLETTSARITEKLVALGGKKAGEVELGWKKAPNLSYYHLTIPEENLDAVKAFLGNFGKLNIQFENHPRLLPAGTNRIILEVKERE